MADTAKNSGESRRHQSRLQRRAPASIQVDPASNYASGWKIAIPLLSPVTVPEDQTVGVSREESQQDRQSSTVEKPKIRSWQHPAAPFYYGPAPIVPAFVRQCT
ncbi:uncharacterized protein At4g14450, chloroplastic-like [Magnolia sinica]|uniref:uncharacterized protein At4g14450, chloroplastic-like n=1 Tax=Magnolia sinica TaxID=86752 RepID=UPI002657E1E2|nr:uncharacterized protein At4g14450, chloroplastic-like [Magnolia sinica]